MAFGDDFELAPVEEQITEDGRLSASSRQSDDSLNLDILANAGNESKGFLSSIGDSAQNIGQTIYDTAIGAGQGLTVDHMDELAAIPETIPDAFKNIGSSDYFEKLLSAYRGNQKAAEEVYNASRERSPWAYNTGFAAGTIAPAVVSAGTSLAPTVVNSATQLGKLANIGKAAATGAGLGAIYGHGSSEGSMVGSKEEQQRLLDDVLMSTAGGGLFGGATKAAGEYVMPATKNTLNSIGRWYESKSDVWPWAKNISTLFRMGKKGVDLGTAEGIQKAEQTLIKPLDKVHGQLENTRAILGQETERAARKSTKNIVLGDEMVPKLKELAKIIEIKAEAGVKSPLVANKFNSQIMNELDGLGYELQKMESNMAKLELPFTIQDKEAYIEKIIRDKITNVPRSALELHTVKKDLNNVYTKMISSENNAVSDDVFNQLMGAKNIINKKLDTIPEYKQANDLLKEFHNKVTNPIGIGKEAVDVADKIAASKASKTADIRKKNLERLFMNSERIGTSGTEARNQGRALYDALNRGEDTLSGSFMDRMVATQNQVKKSNLIEQLLTKNKLSPLKSGDVSKVSAFPQTHKPFKTPVGYEPRKVDTMIPTSGFKESIQEPSREWNAFALTEGLRPTEAKHGLVDGVLGKAPTGLGTIGKFVNEYAGGSGIGGLISGKKIANAKDFILTAGKDRFLELAEKTKNTLPGLSNVLRKGAENPDQLWRSRAGYVIGSTPGYKDMLEELIGRESQDVTGEY